MVAFLANEVIVDGKDNMISQRQVAMPQRSGHERNKSSKSGILKSFVSSKSRPSSPEPSSRRKSHEKGRGTITAPLNPSDQSQSSAQKAMPLGERHHNAQSPPSSPSRPSRLRRDETKSTSPKKVSEKPTRPKNEKSSAGFPKMFAKMNRSKGDLSQPGQSVEGKGKENSLPADVSSSQDSPIWAEFARATLTEPFSPTDAPHRIDVQDEIARYTPRDYSPSKQRNFNGGIERPGDRPTLHPRLLGNRVDGGSATKSKGAENTPDGSKPCPNTYKSLRASKSASGEKDRAKSSFDWGLSGQRTSTDRDTSSHTAERDALHENLTIGKRGGRVLAAVAALQGRVKSKEEPRKQDHETQLDEKEVEKAFEAVLEARNIPEAMRQKMRTLTLRVKADFVKQDQGASKSAGPSPQGSLTAASAKSTDAEVGIVEDERDEGDGKSTKRSRPRSRTFTFSKASKRDEHSSPSKKDRAASKSREHNKSRPNSLQSVKDVAVNAPRPKTPTGNTHKGNRQTLTLPADFISYLHKTQTPADVEVGKLHKLRILLRNETVAWVDSFISLGGMAEIVGLLHQIMKLEWREEHDDQLLHETLLCLKGLCTTERALTELDKVADELFPALVGMLFDEERKGPAEYTTRTIIFQVLFNFLSAGTNKSASELEKRAGRILGYVGEPLKPEDSQPLGFVLEMRARRPYKLWYQEMSNVTREVFWIFLHQLNVIPLPRPSSSARPNSANSTVDPTIEDTADKEEQARILAATYTQRHFPGVRPPVPAAPYIGGVEWDATSYLTAHLDLLNGLMASFPTASARNRLRREFEASGFEKVMGATMRTCKEKFYGGVHDGLRSWVAAASEDDWDTKFVREGPTQEEQADRAKKLMDSPKKGSPKKENPPRLSLQGNVATKLDLKLDEIGDGGERADVLDSEGWVT